jgi:diguanylate cyclase (GGDEF)-like protein/PAS domain S-box-containing protein
LVDPTGRIVLSNTAMRRLIGGMQDQLEGRSFTDLLKLAEAARFRDILAGALCGDGDSPNFVTQGNRPDGTLFDVNLTVIPAVLKDEISGVFVQVREITRLPTAEREQRRMERLNRAILDSLPAHIALIDGSGRIVAVNEAWRRFARENGLRADGAGVGADYIEVFRAATGRSAEGARLVAEGLSELLKGRRRGFALDYACHSSSVRRWFRLHASPVDDSPLAGAVVMHLDVTKRQLATEQARLAANALRQMAEGVLVADNNMRVATTNQAFCRMTGYSASEAAGRNFVEFLAGNHPALVLERVHQALQEHGFWKGELSCRREGGGVFPANVSIATVHADRTAPEHFVAVLNDLSTQQDYERKLDHVSRHDSLTGLANRAALAEHAQLIIASVQGQHETPPLVLIGLDRFKLVNDSLGHAIGDVLLKSVAARLRAAIPVGDVLARLSGDEFAVMLTAVCDIQAAEIRAREIQVALNEAFVVDARPLFVSASVGVSCFPSDGHDFETLLRNADLAMRQAKAAGGNNLSMYAPVMGGGHLEQLTLQSDLQLALERNEFLLHFQPTLALDTGDVVGAEALVRWQHPTLGLLAPSRFIKLAEETGAIVRLGEWVLRTACAEAVRWGREGLGPLSVAVNLSARQFELPDLAARVGTILLETALEPGRLRLEVTESLVMANPQGARKTLSELATMGIHIALDDFGTGYSSLAYLQQFPLHCLKVDRSFVKEIPGNESSNAIARAVVALGKALGLRVVAEGVEVDPQLKFIREAGCHEVQGYLFCKPISRDELLRWIRRRGKRE